MSFGVSLLTATSASATCTISGPTVTCTGDESGGIYFKGYDYPPDYLHTMDINSLTTTIGGTGVEFNGDGADGAKGDDKFATGDMGHPGDAGLALTVTYGDTTNGISTTADGAIGIYATSKGGKGGEGGTGIWDFFVDTHGGEGGTGGEGGDIYVDSSALIQTTGTLAHGILAVSDGGDGGKGGFAEVSVFAQGGDGGTGAASGTVTVISRDDITTEGSQAQGIYAQSLGGQGGDGGAGDGAFGGGGGGAGGGIAKAVTVENYGVITTTGAGAGGIIAQSVGGFAGSGGTGVALFAFGSSDQSGGYAGTVAVDNYATITTTGDAATAIIAQSTGGGGGAANTNVGVVALGGTSENNTSDGNRSDTVTVYNSADLSTQGHASLGIMAQSIGGGGGSGGTSVALVSIGGQGGTGGNGADVNLSNLGDVSTVGDHADAILAHSAGGGGGKGGFAGGLIAAVGGEAGGGGDGKTVTVTNTGDLSTLGEHSNALLVQSIGGGGGKGGSSVDIGAFVSIGVGGKGGDGGDGGEVYVNQDVDANSSGTTVTTQGKHSAGVVAQSTGGGGGKGGWTVSASGGYIGDVSIGVGGNGADGGNGDVVVLHNSGIVTTEGDFSDGIIAQSQGGGGGLGGFDVTIAGATNGALAVGVGGGGGSGGDSGAVTLESWTDVTTNGDHSTGILAQSAAGTGGHGGFSVTLAASGDASISVGVGGDGGSGGNASGVTLTSVGDVSTGDDGSAGAHSSAIIAQSIGGGGGNGGFDVTLAGSESFNVAVGVGGKGGGGGNAKSVTASSTGDLTTIGDHGHGLIAQSIGGGGGNGGFSIALTGSAEGADVPVSIGGDGSTGGISGSVTLTNDGNVTTSGAHASAIIAQSQAGGGGTGGFSISGAVNFGDGANVPVTVGGGGGSGRHADTVSVVSTGNITTGADGDASHSDGIRAQSIGGGGGDGGFSVAGSIVTGGDGGDISVSVGGKGGTGSYGDTVSVTSTGDISTSGTRSVGIKAQSVGGGGGSGGFSGVFDGAKNGNISVSVGGEGGVGNDGGDVTVVSDGAVETKGEKSYGILAQSTGGGGGDGGFALSGSLSKGTNVNVDVGGKGAGGGDGGTVEVTQTGDVSTDGKGAYAIFAQSVGNSGGSGGFAGSVGIDISDGSNVGVNVGGGGGSGGTGGEVTVTALGGAIETKDQGSTGIKAQSVGGSGGDGGFAFTGDLGNAEKQLNISVTVGGGGGSGGTAGMVSVANSSSIKTEGDKSDGIHAQSTGGSGGSGGMALTANLSLNTSSPGLNLGVSVGGGGGDGNSASDVEVASSGDIETSGYKSYGIYAQSIGGGGGDGGLAFSGNLAGGQSSKEINVSVGGSGGTGNTAGKVTVTNSGAVTTTGDQAQAIHVHSVGGGGGTGGTAITAALSRQGQGTSLEFGVSIGGKGGTGGDSDDVTVTNSGVLTTEGVASHAIDAKSIGGGGGTGGSTVAGIAGLSQSGTANPRTLDINVGVGGQGGAAGNAGKVSVDNEGDITTTAGSAQGIRAQSVGGGGGSGGAADTFAFLVGTTVGQNQPDDGEKSLKLSVSVGGAGGGGGNADDVTVENSGDISTMGGASDGIFAQSVGGGGGEGGNGDLGLAPILGTFGVILEDGEIILHPLESLKIWTDVQIAIGGSGGSAGDGAKVDVTNSGNISTEGNNSNGIYAHSIGGGGGRGGNTDGTAFAVLALGAKGDSGGNADTVMVDNSGDITTQGKSSAGIFAQSIGGGGGHGGDNHQNLFWPGLNVGIGIDLALGGGKGGNGADVTVDNEGTITTYGAGAHGIFAQSTGGGGGVAGSPGISPGSAFGFIGTNGDAGDAGTVTVNHTGDIYTHGDGTAGIFAQSGSGSADTDTGDDFAQGATGTGKTVDITVGGDVVSDGLNSRGIIGQSIGMNANSAITVQIDAGGMVSGGTDTVLDGDASDKVAAGIQLLDGADNLIDNSGTITSQIDYLGTAILTQTTTANTTTINDTVQNYSIITGSIYLGGVTNVLNNHVGARMNMGADIDIGAGNTLTNDGLVSPGGVDQVFTSTVTGNYNQSATGEYEVDVDFQIADDNPGDPGEADLIHVTGSSQLDGTVKVNAVNSAYLEPDQSGKVLIFESESDYGTPTLDAPDTVVVDYELSYDTTSTYNVYLEWMVDYTPDGLNRNQTAIGNYFYRTVQEGDPDALSDFLNPILEAPDIVTLRDYYNQLSAEAYVENEISTMFNAREFTQALIDCKQTAFPTDDEKCMWFRLSGTNTQKQESFDYFGYTDLSVDVEGGVGGDISDTQSIAAAVGYGRTQINTEDYASSTGNRVQGGLSASANAEGTTLALAAVGGAAFFDVERTITMTGDRMVAEGNQNMYYGGGQVRLQHEARSGWFSFIPLVEAWGGYFYHDSVSETGAGAASLDVESGDNIYGAVRPGLTLAAETESADGTKVRAFVSGGYTYYFAGNEDYGPGVTASMQGDGDLVPGFTVTSALSPYYVDAEMGFDVQGTNGTIFRLSGGAQYGVDYLSYGGDMQFVMPF